MRVFSKGALCLAVMLTALASLAAKRNPIVTVVQGKIEGRYWPGGRGAYFKGVPFAQPPIGELRWRAPEPPKPWTGIRQAATFAPACAQEHAGAWNSIAAETGSENCLYLNIWTPEWPPKRKYPVMVWIHGGGNEGGWAGAPVFDGEPLARHGVIIVTIQYRLGMFGFLALPELTRESPHHTSGDYGIMDQIAALEWVHENISRFGGDPSQVTVFGQSAGALDTGILQTSPPAKGLFARAIQESGPVGLGGRPLPSLAASERNGERLVAGLHPPSADPLKYLRSLSTAAIIKAQPPYLHGGIGPNVDGYVIPRDPAEAFAAGEETATPLMIGNNAREMTAPGGPSALKKDIEAFYGKYAPQALRFYGLAGNPPASTYPPYGDANAQYQTDMLFRCPTVDEASEHSRIAPTYEYEFSLQFPGSPAQGAVHSTEFGYVFGTFGLIAGSATGRQITALSRALDQWCGCGWAGSDLGNQIGAVTPAEARISADMQAYWTNFAKTGNPNGASLPEWPEHNATSQKYLEMSDQGLAVKEKLRSGICTIYNSAVAEHEKNASHEGN